MTRVLTDRSGQRFTFDAGSFALELLLTGGPGAYAVWEMLHEPADLAEWLTGSRLAATAPLRAEDIRITATDLTRVKEFRDTLWHVTEAVVRGDRPSGADLLVINDGTGRAPVLRLEPTTMTRAWRTPLHGSQVLGAAATDAIGVLADAPRGRLRQCAADDCPLLFVDTSRPGNRRWCSMQRCGNRAKVTAHRTRS